MHIDPASLRRALHAAVDAFCDALSGETLAPDGSSGDVEASAPPDSEVLTVVQLAQLLRLSKKTVYEMVQRGEIPGARSCGRVIRFHRPSIDAWLAQGRGRAPKVSPRRARR